MKFTDLVLQLDSAGMQAESGFTWAKRAFILRARAPVPAAAAVAPTLPAGTPPPVAVKVPGS